MTEKAQSDCKQSMGWTFKGAMHSSTKFNFPPSLIKITKKLIKIIGFQAITDAFVFALWCIKWFK